MKALGVAAVMYFKTLHKKQLKIKIKGLIWTTLEHSIHQQVLQNYYSKERSQCVPHRHKSVLNNFSDKDIGEVSLTWNEFDPMALDV